MIFNPVPIGTVLFVQITLYPFKFSPIARATLNIASKFDEPFSPSGVPTAINMTSDSSIESSMLPEKDNRPDNTFL